MRGEMSEQLFCPVQTYPRTRDTPAEFCDELVSDYGDLCELHDEADRADDQYENYLESLRKES